MKLPEKVLNASVSELKIYLNQHAKYKSIKNQILIKKLIEKKLKENSELANKLCKSPLSRLAGIELLRKGKKRKEILANPFLVFDKMRDILNRAEEQQQLAILQSYLNRYK